MTLVSAGAGSGKTQRLTAVVTEAISPHGAAPIPLDGLVAVTYTRKAAAELAARIRQTLITSDESALARELPLANLGTVHSVCLRWLRELALDAGLSPLADVLPGDETVALRQALESGLPRELSSRLDALAEQLAIQYDARIKRWDWHPSVNEVMTLARSNCIPPLAVPAMGVRASQRLRALMGAPEASAEALDAELAEVIDTTLDGLAPLNTGPKNVQRAHELLEDVRHRSRRGELRWADWIALQKMDAGKVGRPIVARLQEVARRVDHHPRLHSQVNEFILAVYEAAATGLHAYAAWKHERRLVDFVDMVDQALKLLDTPDVLQDLEQRLSLCVVDEFQDTSPAQLALFVKLHRLCKRSTWVGDPKQCIFEYAGADPELMDAVTSWVAEAGGMTETLLRNRRSRPELVGACSRLFEGAFAKDGYSPAQVGMAAQRVTPPALEALPPFGLWWLEGSRREQALDAMANGISRMLREPLATPVIDRVSDSARGLQPGDVAVLLATNVEAIHLTAALAQRGIRTAVARGGLLRTPEGVLIQAALSYVVDPRDTRSLAIIEALSGFEGRSPDNWLEGRVAQHQELLLARQQNRENERKETSSVAVALEQVRHELSTLGPAEALDRVLGVLDAATLCARWPTPDQRRANLEALRALAARYETHSRHEREAASVNGLLRYFDASQQAPMHDAEQSSDHQHATQNADCVTVTTYHRAKGLEWPVVVLGSLDREERRDAFSVLPVSTRATFDPTDPLGGRWIRYFPWPYGQHRNAPLADAVGSAEEGQQVRHREARERVRLLYVGFTRARDHLVLTVRPGRQRPNTPWLDELSDTNGTPLLALPTQGPSVETSHLTIRQSDGTLMPFRTRTWRLRGETAASPPAAESTFWFESASAPAEARSRYGISPSRCQHDWPELELGTVGSIIDFGSRLPLGSRSPKDWNRVGDVVHAFLAADLHALSAEQRLMCAERLLRASQLQLLLQPNALVGASNDLRAWVARVWPGATWHRELPVRGVVDTPQGARAIDGIIDLLLDVGDGVVLVDYKSYPGRRDTWQERAREYAPQLAAYARVLGMAGHNVLGQWICFVVTGGAVPVNLRHQPHPAAAPKA